MIYLDNAATTLRKPPQVEQAVLDAMRTAGNPGRGAHEPTLHASRLVYAARCAMAKLLHAPDPSCIAFAANATEALNIALGGLFAPGDHIITTVCEHNSVLRPLYRLREQGLQFSFAGVDERGRQRMHARARRITPAYAGKRPSRSKNPARTPDHPRMCGEKKLRSVSTISAIGSPPRMRGKDAANSFRTQFYGITPAYAGKS